MFDVSSVRMIPNWSRFGWPGRCRPEDEKDLRSRIVFLKSHELVLVTKYQWILSPTGSACKPLHVEICSMLVGWENLQPQRATLTRS